MTFVPGEIKPANYRFSIGTAGSATLVLQTILPALITTQQSSQLTLEGGMHNPLAPTFEFLADQLLLPLAIAGSGSFSTLPLSLHTRTQMELIPLFLARSIQVAEADEATVVTVISQ